MSYFSSLDLSTLPPPPPLAFLTCAVKKGWGVDELGAEVTVEYSAFLVVVI